MKRGFVVLLLLLAASADARRVIHIPTLRELCPGNDDWDKVAQCIRRQSSFKLLRDDADLKLVQIVSGARLNGIYLYRHQKRWTLQGELRLDQEADVIGFERIKLGKHAGYRLDIGVSSPMPLSFDDETSIPGLLRRQFSQLCFDDSFACHEVMTACDVLVHGKAYYSFRGKLVYADQQIKVVGDRRNAGAFCASAEVVVSD